MSQAAAPKARSRTHPSDLIRMKVLWDVAHHPGSDALDVAKRLRISLMKAAEIMDELAADGILGVDA
jgi:hypothetical protein